jgi:hypothetical protein
MEEKINKFTKKLFEDFSQEKLPADFTEKLMVKIEHEQALAKQPKSLFSRKFMILFLGTFLSIFMIGYYFSGTTEKNDTTYHITEKLILPKFDFGKITSLFDFNIEISLFIKLFVVSIIILLVIDLLSGSVIDYFLDSKTKKEGQ